MLLFIAYLAKRYFHKSCILVNHTVDIHDPVMRDIVARVYPLLDDVVFREPLSAAACAGYCDPLAAADAAFIYKPAPSAAWETTTARSDYFSVWPDSAKHFDPREPYVCVGGSSIYLRNDRLAYDPRPGFTALCKLLDKQIAHVVLLAADYTDQEIFRPIAKDLNLPLLGLATPVQQVIDVLGHAQLYVGGRWHSSVLALTGGTPIITLTANTYKTQDILQQIGLKTYALDALQLHTVIEDTGHIANQCIEEGQLSTRSFVFTLRSY